MSAQQSEAVASSRRRIFNESAALLAGGAVGAAGVCAAVTPTSE